MKGDQPEMNFVPKSWGFEKWIVNKSKYCGKLLYMVKDRKMSLHYHKQKDEVFYIQSGIVKVLFSDETEFALSIKIKGGTPHEELCESIILQKGDNFHVPVHRIHQIIALQDSEIFEFSTQHFDDDSYRILKGS